MTESDPIESAESLIASARPREAAQALKSLLVAGRAGILARLTLVKALLAAGDTRLALNEAREAVNLHPNVGICVLTLGKALLAAELLPSAIAEFQRALRLDPELMEAHELSASCWLAVGEADKALEILDRLDFAPHRAEMIEAARAKKLRLRCDHGYVRHLFDQFSADYDARMLDQLRYNAPQILTHLADLVMGQRESLSILDLGCGTGLAGAAFKQRARNLEGVDLSPLMIEKANQRGIYDQLVVADLESLLGADGPKYDLIIAADTLVYFGDLTQVLTGAARHLDRDGFFLFTTEAKHQTGYDLGPKRRWRHSEAYLRESAEKAGLRLCGLVACEPRQEAGKPVEGWAVALGL